MTIDTIRNTTDIPTVITDGQGLITTVNDVFNQTFGWEAEEIVGEHLAVLIPPEFHDAHNMGFSRFLATETPKIIGQSLPLTAQSKSGTIHNITLFIVGEKDGDDWIFAATLAPLDA